MDLSRASERTKAIHKVLLQQPFSTAGNIALRTGDDEELVSNALRRSEIGSHGRRKESNPDDYDLVFHVTMGRVRQAADRYAHSYAGVVSLEQELGVAPQWANSLSGLRRVTGQLQLAEVVYEILPHFWQFNTIAGCDVYVQVVTPSGKLLRRDWTLAHMTDFWWFRSGTFAGIARYENPLQPDTQVFLPVMWCGPYHTAQHIQGLRNKLARKLEMPWDYTRAGIMPSSDVRPGVFIVVPDPLVGARVRQMLRQHRQPIAACIVDVHKRVIQAMEEPTFPWSGWKDRGGKGPEGLPTRFQLNVPQDIKAGLEEPEGMWSAINGVDRWRLFYESIAPMPGLPVKNLAETSNMPEPRVSEYTDKMREAGLVKRRSEGAWVPDARGRTVLAVTEGVAQKVVDHRLGIFADETSSYCEDQRPHTIAVATCIGGARSNGILAFPALGLTVKPRDRQRRAVPDGALALASGLVMPFEYEQSARSVASAMNKLYKYRRLADLGVPVPFMVIVPTLRAASNFVEAMGKMCWRHGLVAVQQRFISGSYGSASIDKDGRVDMDPPGIFGYPFVNRTSPSFDAPLDMWDKLEDYPEWRTKITPLALGEWDTLDWRGLELREWNREWESQVVSDLLCSGEMALLPPRGASLEEILGPRR